MVNKIFRVLSLVWIGFVSLVNGFVQSWMFFFAACFIAYISKGGYDPVTQLDTDRVWSVMFNWMAIAVCATGIIRSFWIAYQLFEKELVEADCIEAEIVPAIECVHVQLERPFQRGSSLLIPRARTLDNGDGSESTTHYKGYKAA